MTFILSHVHFCCAYGTDCLEDYYVVSLPICIVVAAQLLYTVAS